MRVHDPRICVLGEGPLWHPERNALFWFDILGKQLLGPEVSWGFEDHVSAAGWIDRDNLLVASETALWSFDLTSGDKTMLAPLEADNPMTRSNDGRADPYGGFWIGTMGKQAEQGAGAIYRYYRGEVRQLYSGISIPNSICFTPDGAWACFADTPTRQIMRVALDGQGWPVRAAQVYVDLRAEKLNPDGSVIDTAGRLWNAQWGAGRVACYGPDGCVGTLKVPASQTTCPAFGGPDLATLFITSAAEGLDDPQAGLTYTCETDATGQPEHQVIL